MNLSTNEKRPVSLLGIPLGFGAGKPGSELGVAAMRTAQVLNKTLPELISDVGFDYENAGDVQIPPVSRKAQPEENPKFLTEYLSAAADISKKLHDILDRGRLPVILGGDHSIAAATFSAIAKHYRETNEIGLLWFDAHADINDLDTSPSKNLHGMPLGAIFGSGADELVMLEGYSPKLKSEFFAHIGARDLDRGEREMIARLGLRSNFFTMSDIDRRGIVACMTDAIDIVGRAPGGFAVTFDVDIIDPRFAPGSGTLVRGGCTYREAHTALEMIAETGKMRSFEIVEVNPTLDQSNITVELGVELILSALGKTIL